MNACITPGIQPTIVSMILIRKAEPIPCFIKTARGGNNIFKIIVNGDIYSFFLND